MKCRAVSTRLSEYLCGDLPPHRSAAFREHLATCAACRCRMASLERALKDLKRPTTFFEAPDLLAEVEARAQGGRKPVFRLAAAYGMSGLSALLLAYWMCARPSVQVPPERPATVKMETTVKEVAQAQGLEESAATPTPRPAAPARRRVVRPRQSRGYTQVAGSEPTRTSGADEPNEIVIAAAIEPEPSNVSLSNTDVSSPPEREPGELRYQYMNGQGYVFREANLALDGSPVRVDVMAVPVDDAPYYACTNTDTLACAEHIVKRREGAM